jgi:hypothetical protein
MSLRLTDGDENRLRGLRRISSLPPIFRGAVSAGVVTQTRQLGVVSMRALTPSSRMGLEPGAPLYRPQSDQRHIVRLHIRTEPQHLADGRIEQRFHCRRARSVQGVDQSSFSELLAALHSRFQHSV